MTVFIHVIYLFYQSFNFFMISHANSFFYLLLRSMIKNNVDFAFLKLLLMYFLLGLQCQIFLKSLIIYMIIWQLKTFLFVIPWEHSLFQFLFLLESFTFHFYRELSGHVISAQVNSCIRSYLSLLLTIFES